MAGIRGEREHHDALGRPNEADDWAGAGQPDQALIRAQLGRILGSNEFLGSERPRRFLRYVVEEALAGRGDRIKAYSVAVAAFDRDESFDPQTDPIVRIEAGRLRRRLERYYLVDGSADPVRIEIPKGGYVPLFSRPDGGEAPASPALPGASDQVPPAAVPTPASPVPLLGRPVGVALLLALIALLVAGLGFAMLTRAPWGAPPEVVLPSLLPEPSVAVLAFGVTGQATASYDLSAGMTNEIVKELSQQSEVFVLGPRSLLRFGPKPDVTVVGRVSGAAYVLSGEIQHAGEWIRVAVQLSEAQAGGIVWAETYDREYTAANLLELEAEVAKKIVSAIAPPKGAVLPFDGTSR
jgi:TolB-like protein